MLRPGQIRKLLGGLLVIAVALQPGCAGRQPELPAGSAHDLALTGLPVVSVLTPPSSNLDAYAKGRLKGALKGTGEGLVKGMLAPFSGGGSCGGEFCAIVILAMMAVGGTVGAVVGGITGTLEAVPVATAEEVEATLQQALRDLRATPRLVQALVARASVDTVPQLLPLADEVGLEQSGGLLDYPQLADRTYPAILEVRVSQVNYQVDKPTRKELGLALEVHAIATLVPLRDNGERIESEFIYRSPPQPFAVWNGHDDQYFVNQFETALENLADQIINAVQAELVACVDSRVHAVNQVMTADGCNCWTSPLTPPPFAESRFWRGGHEEVVASLQPVLSWESFPQWHNGQPPAGWDGMVKFELKIWELDSKGQYQLVYRKAGLVENRHTIEVPLNSGSRYAWTVRAAYRVDGVPYLTGWASPCSPALRDCRKQPLPAGVFRFRAP